MTPPEKPDRRDEVARRLDALREAKNLKLSELEKLAGISPGTLSAYHTGRRKGRKIPLGVAAQICHALGATVGKDLLGEDAPAVVLPPGIDLAQMSQTEKDALIFHLMAEVLQRGLQVPPMLPPRSDDVSDVP